MLLKFIFFCVNVACISMLLSHGEQSEARAEQELKKPRKLTMISEDDLTKVLRESYYNVHRKRADDNTIASAWAQIALENNRGKRVWNYNLGNIGNSPGSKPVPYYDHFGKTSYRSFASFIEAGEAYWRVISKCKAAVVHFKSGLPKAAANSLKRCNYYRANEKQYSAALSSLYAEGIRRFGK